MKKDKFGFKRLPKQDRKPSFTVLEKNAKITRQNSLKITPQKKRITIRNSLF
jgi:hypothetical protein